MSDDAIRIAELAGEEDPQVHELLVELGLEDQRRYVSHPQETRRQLSARLRAEPTFVGENHIFVARDGAGSALGLSWVVLFDPGTGLEGEIAELYVRPEARSRGIAGRLVSAAAAPMLGSATSSRITLTSSPTCAVSATAEVSTFCRMEMCSRIFSSSSTKRVLASSSMPRRASAAT